MTPTLHPIRTPATVLALALLAFAVLTLSACASAPVPNEQMAVAEAAVQRANSTGTHDLAAVELQRASGKLASARQAMGSKDYDRARQLAEQAEADALVAESHAQSARSRLAAQESQDAARVLREELARKAPL
ncbi:MAG: DUF4398 domain-containing protein [Ideonella sp.]|jgi:hypothetical protein|nr:DUF4398 domain-containing protein [Ideonella sp.]MBL0147487.1 DUF4398 domain-containing protein [Ideonella sp.]